MMYGNNYNPYQNYYSPNGAVPDVLNQYKGQYQPMMQQPVQPLQNMQQVPQTSSDLLWVLNETEATSYPVAPNNSVTLWDKNKDTVYIKSVNAQGVPSMRILDYTERGVEGEKKPSEHVCKCEGKYVPMETYNALVAQIDVLRAKVDALTLAAKPKTKVKEETDNG